MAVYLPITFAEVVEMALHNYSYVPILWTIIYEDSLQALDEPMHCSLGLEEPKWL